LVCETFYGLSAHAVACFLGSLHVSTPDRVLVNLSREPLRLRCVNISFLARVSDGFGGQSRLFSELAPKDPWGFGFCLAHGPHDWSPWVALLHMRERWPELRFKMKAGYLEMGGSRKKRPS